MYRLMPAVLLTIVYGAVGAQQPAKAFVTPASVSASGVRHSKLSLAEQMRRRPDILTNEAVSGFAAEFAARRKTLGETVLMSSDEKTFYIFVHRTESSRPEVPRAGTTS
jgi:hypothetical protein